jgi:tetratricopeptide (TPR) repeat protein
MKRTLLALCIVTLGLRGAPAFALEPAAASSESVDQARDHFRRGAELFKEGSFDAALAEFQRAYQIVPNYRVLYNIAQVQLERHDYAAAQTAFTEYLKQGDSEIAAERRSEVEEELRTLRTRVVELTVTSNVDGAELSVDGVTVGKLPLIKPILVSTGVRRLSLQKPGFTRGERTVSVAGGERPVIEISLEPLRAAPASSTRPAGEAPGAPAERSHTGVWIGVVTTGVLAGGAVTFGLLARHNNEQLDKELARFPGDGERIDSARSKVKLFAGLSDGAAGASLVAAAITLYAALSSSGAETPPKQAARFGPRARLVPSFDRISVLGEF